MDEINNNLVDNTANVSTVNQAQANITQQEQSVGVTTPAAQNVIGNYSATAVTDGVPNMNQFKTEKFQTYANQMGDIYNQRMQNTQNQMNQAYQQSLKSMEEQKEEGVKAYQQQANQYGAQGQIAQKNANAYNQYNGVNTGAASQQALSQSNAYQAGMASIDKGRADFEANVAKAIADMETEYRNNLANALTNGQFELAQQIYSMMQSEDTYREQLALTWAQNGDFSLLEELGLYSPTALNNLKLQYGLSGQAGSDQILDELIRNGVVSGEYIYQLTGKELGGYQAPRYYYAPAKVEDTTSSKKGSTSGQSAESKKMANMVKNAEADYKAGLISKAQYDGIKQTAQVKAAAATDNSVQKTATTSSGQQYTTYTGYKGGNQNTYTNGNPNLNATYEQAFKDALKQADTSLKAQGELGINALKENISNFSNTNGFLSVNGKIETYNPNKNLIKETKNGKETYTDEKNALAFTESAQNWQQNADKYRSLGFTREEFNGLTPQFQNSLAYGAATEDAIVDMMTRFNKEMGTNSTWQDLPEAERKWVFNAYGGEYKEIFGNYEGMNKAITDYELVASTKGSDVGKIARQKEYGAVKASSNDGSFYQLMSDSMYAGDLNLHNPDGSLVTNENELEIANKDYIAAHPEVMVFASNLKPTISKETQSLQNSQRQIEVYNKWVESMTNPDVKLSDQDYVILKSFINELTNGEPIKEEGLAPNELIIGDEQPATQSGETTAPASKNSNPFKEERWVDTIKNTGENVKSGAQSIIDFLNTRPAEPGGLLYNSQNKPLADNELIIGENEKVIGDTPEQLASNELIIGDGNNYEKPAQNYNGNSIEEIVNDILYSRPVGENGILNKNKPGSLDQRAVQYEDEARSFNPSYDEYDNERDRREMEYNASLKKDYAEEKYGTPAPASSSYIEKKYGAFPVGTKETPENRELSYEGYAGQKYGVGTPVGSYIEKKYGAFPVDTYETPENRELSYESYAGQKYGAGTPVGSDYIEDKYGSFPERKEEASKDLEGRNLSTKSMYDYGSEQAQMGYKSSVNDSFTIDDYMAAAKKANSKPSASERIGLPQNTKEVTRQIPEPEISSERTRAQLGDGYLDALAEAIKNNDTSANYYAQALESLGYTKEQVRFALNGRYNIKI